MNSEAVLGLANDEVTGIEHRGTVVRITARYLGSIACPDWHGERCGVGDSSSIDASGRPEKESKKMSKQDLKIETWQIERLVPYARNARLHSEAQVAQIAASITEFGFNNPVLVGSDGGIIAGHARVLAARKPGDRQIPVIVLGHLTENQKRALIDWSAPTISYALYSH